MIHAAIAALTAFTLLVCLGGCALVDVRGPAPGSPDRARLEQLLTAVRVVAERPRPGGYERGCGSGEGCVFGPAWTDDYAGPGGRDGCDTRNNVLARQLTGIGYRPGTGRCVVQSGTLADPYTGTRIEFAKSSAQQVPIDHVYPLAAAWDLGAAGWPPALRIRFANDIEYNLQATARAANVDKSDSTPARWLPPARPGHCYYAGKYLLVALRYDLPVTAADHAALREVAQRCG